MGYAAAIAVLVLASLAMGVRCLVMAVRLQDMPLSRARSAAQGLVEMQGIATPMPGPPIVSPLSRTPCIWWQYRVTCRGEGPVSGSGGVQMIAEETSSDCFHLTDASGKVIVDPVGAHVIPSFSRVWRGVEEWPGRVPKPGWDAFFTYGKYRFSEKIVRCQELLLVRGFFRTQPALLPQGESRDVAELLREWKRDRRRLLARFDANHDGEIDLAEWEVARQEALEEVHRRDLEPAATPGMNVIGEPPTGGGYLISAVRRPALIHHYERQAIGYLAGALVLTSVLARVLVAVRP